MAVDILVPQLGESVIEATVGKWLKQIGDTVAPGEPLVELETDKVNLEVTAEQGGVLRNIARDTGSVVGVGEALGHIAASDGAMDTVPVQPVAAAPAIQPTTAGDNGARAATASTPTPTGSSVRPRTTPVAGRI